MSETKLETTLTRRYTFSGLFKTPEGAYTGRRIILEVTLSGNIRPPSYWIISRDLMDDWVKSRVIDPLDKTDLSHNPQPESMALTIHQRLQAAPKDCQLKGVLVRYDAQTFSSIP